MSYIERVLMEIFYIVMGAWSISCAIAYLDDERYFLFGLEVMIAAAMIVGLGGIMILRVVELF